MPEAEGGALLIPARQPDEAESEILHSGGSGAPFFAFASQALVFLNHGAPVGLRVSLGVGTFATSSRLTIFGAPRV